MNNFQKTLADISSFLKDVEQQAKRMDAAMQSLAKQSMDVRSGQTSAEALKSKISESFTSLLQATETVHTEITSMFTSINALNDTIEMTRGVEAETSESIATLNALITHTGHIPNT